MDKTPLPVLETERLRLQAFTERDLTALPAIYGDEGANLFLPWFPLRSLEEARELYESRYAGAEHALPYRYAIALKADDQPIGYLHVSADESHDLGYGLRRSFWHRGIATEAGRAVVALARQDGLPYLTATHDVKNPRRGAVMRRLGMTYRYTYEEQWQPKDILSTFRMYQINLDGVEERVYRKYWDQASVRYLEPDPGG